MKDCPNLAEAEGFFFFYWFDHPIIQSNSLYFKLASLTCKYKTEDTHFRGCRTWNGKQPLIGKARICCWGGGSRSFESQQAQVERAAHFSSSPDKPELCIIYIINQPLSHKHRLKTFQNSVQPTKLKLSFGGFSDSHCWSLEWHEALQACIPAGLAGCRRSGTRSVFQPSFEWCSCHNSTWDRGLTFHSSFWVCSSSDPTAAPPKNIGSF